MHGASGGETSAADIAYVEYRDVGRERIVPVSVSIETRAFHQLEYLIRHYLAGNRIKIVRGIRAFPIRSREPRSPSEVKRAHRRYILSPRLENSFE